MSIGQSAVISWLANDKSISKRLSDLGFEPGGTVTCILKKCGGELSAYFVRGALIALRREDAELVLVDDLVREQEAEHT